jgi:hypothetical protein
MKLFAHFRVIEELPTHDLPRVPAYLKRGRFFIDKPLGIDGFGGNFAWRVYVAAGCGGYGW